jgi:hypothetical protein
MATPNDKKNQQAPASSSDFDWSKFSIEGFDAKDFEKIGGLAPIYAPEAAFAGNFPPLVGFPVRTQFLPEVKQGKEIFIPKMIMFHVMVPTKGVTGKRRDGQTIVDLKKGDYCLVPVTGNLETNERLLAAADDPESVSFVGMRVAGQRQVNDMPSPMWDWDVQLNTAKRLPRKGTEYARLLESNERPTRELGPGTTATGQQYDRQTGEVRAS